MREQVMLMPLWGFCCKQTLSVVKLMCRLYLQKSADGQRGCGGFPCGGFLKVVFIFYNGIFIAHERVYGHALFLCLGIETFEEGG